MKYLPVKLYFTREKKTKRMPVKKKMRACKNGKKCAWKQRSVLENTQVTKKIGFTGTFEFHGEKNTDHKRCRWATDRLQQHTLVTDQTDLGHQGL